MNGTTTAGSSGRRWVAAVFTVISARRTGAPRGLTELPRGGKELVAGGGGRLAPDPDCQSKL